MNKTEFKQLVSRKIVILDGATGTELVKAGMPTGVSPEFYVFEHPEVINNIHNAYFAAGSDIVYIPSFGGNRCKLAEFGLADRLAEINTALAYNAKQNAVGKGLVFGDISPTGEFLKPWGSLDFEELVDIYKEQITALAAGGADGLAIETMLDLQQCRAALLAAKESAPQLPVIITLTFDQYGRTLSGNDALSSLITLQSLGADAFGCNCSTGPEQMLKLLAAIKPYAEIPLIAKPNAGMPKLVGDRTVFEMSPAEFGAFAPQFAAAGVSIAGGCCGTSPAHIKALNEALKFEPVPVIKAEKSSLVCSASRVTSLAKDGKLQIIGERINPTGKKKLQAELRSGSLDLATQFAREQTAQGSGVLDMNLGLGGIDEKAMMLACMEKVMAVTDLPLCIDSTTPEVVELALRRYPGRALLNSISAEKERIEKLLPIAAKYGAMLILLPVADSGIPATLPERIECVKQIFAAASQYGYRKQDVLVDALVMTVAADGSAGKAALDLIDWAANDFGCGTTGGLSNVSFGLPERKVLNSTFLAMAMTKGLSSVIANPASGELQTARLAAEALRGRDESCLDYLNLFSNLPPSAVSTPTESHSAEQLSPLETVKNLVISGDSANLLPAVDDALNHNESANDIMTLALIAGINVVGELFSTGKYFLPQLLRSADAMQAAMHKIEPLLAESRSAQKQEKVIIATVEGDIHDIGKNIVALMLRNYGFEVIDLGKDVPATKIISAIKEHNARFCGLSALMTTTMPRMKEVINLAQEEELLNVRFIVGGAAVDADYAHSIGATYAKDAMDTVKLCSD